MKNTSDIPGKCTILGRRYEKQLENKTPFESNVKNEARQQIVELLSQSRLYSKPCLCGEKDIDRSEVLSLVERNELPIRNILCKNCGLIRVDPLPEEDFYATVYKNWYWKLMHGNMELTQNRFNFSVKRAIPYWNYLKSRCSLSSTTVLEIGASYGAGLSVLKEQGCRQLVGYDYDKEFIKKGIEYSGVDLRDGGISEAVNDGNRYDIVMLRHVLEHFLDPARELQNLKNLLNDQGLLFVEVPGVFNMSNYSYDFKMYFDIFHPFSFSLNTLSMLMHSCGFSMVDGTDYVYSLWKINGCSDDNHRICSDEYLKIRNHIINTENKRYRIDKFNNSYLRKAYNYSTNYIKIIKSKFHRK